MAKVQVLSIFHDLEVNVVRNAGDIFECTDTRADELNGKKLVAILEKDSPIKPKEDKSEKPLYKKK